MSMTDTVGDVDIQTFEQAFEEDREPCSIAIAVEIMPGIVIKTDKCTNRATWFLLCPHDRSAETLCDRHKADINGWPPDSDIMFDETCGHRVPVDECLWEPYV